MLQCRRMQFTGALLVETAAEVPNPGRGWYQVYSFDVREAIDEEELKWCLNVQEHLALVTLDIGCCRDRELVDEEFLNIRRIFDFFAAHGKQMIVRTVYDREGKGPEREPETFALVLRHIRQLGPLFAKYAAYILTLQGLLVGSWGELHDSRYLSDTKLYQLVKTMWEATGGTCCLSVRRPVQRRILCASPDSAAWKIGLFDDGLFASASHLGTFAEGEYGAKNAVDGQGHLINSQPWPTVDELGYLDRECVRVPNGGEAPDSLGTGECSGSRKEADRPSQNEILDTMRCMHLTYLNRVYSEKVISGWKQMKYFGEDAAYRGCTLYDYIGLHLGYRFVIESVSVSPDRGRSFMMQPGSKKGRIETLFSSIGKWKSGSGDQSLTLTIRGRNVGFGNLYRSAQLTLIARGSDGCEMRKSLDTDPREWDAGKEFRVTAEWPGEAAADIDGMPWREELFLRLKQEDGETIWFANRNAKNLLPIGTVFGWKPRREFSS